MLPRSRTTSTLENHERWNEQGVCYLFLDLPFPIREKIDGHRTQSAPNRPLRPLQLPQPPDPSQGESTFGDSSGRLFNMYSKASEEEDNNMVERWQKDADGILIFVSHRVHTHAACP